MEIRFWVFQNHVINVQNQRSQKPLTPRKRRVTGVDRAVNRQPDFRPETFVSRMFIAQNIFQIYLLNAWIIYNHSKYFFKKKYENIQKKWSFFDNLEHLAEA